MTDAALDVGIGFGLSVLFGVGLLQFGKMIWWIYVQTPVGQHYAQLFVEEALATSGLYGRDLTQLALGVSGTVLKTSLVSGAVSQAFMLTSHFYEANDGLERFLFWTVPFAGMVSWHVQGILYLSGSAAFTLVWLAAAFVLEPCMRLTSRIIPDGLVPRMIWRLLFESWCLLMRCAGR